MCSPVKKHDDKEELNNNIINNPSDLYREGKTKSKMKKKIIKATLAVVAVSVVGAGVFRTYVSFNPSTESALLLENAEAQSFDFGEWWDSKTHSCQEDQCSLTIGPLTWYGKYEKCLNGNTMAHCWDCKICDAITSN